MTMWVDNRNRHPQGSALTHALVVGTSYYEYLPGGGAPARAGIVTGGLQNATTPASGAFAFACWLRDSFRNPNAPLGTITLLLSPSSVETSANPELHSVAKSVDRARRAEVENALFEWSALCTDPRHIAVFYAAGHGIQLSYEDSFVLLEDFAANGNVMNFSINVGSVWRGLAGVTMAQTQLFFVDACRLEPTEFRAYAHLGDGLGLPERAGGADIRTSPIYFSSSPDTPAFGEPGRGTIFSQALMDCLNTYLAADDNPDDADRWWATTVSLGRALQGRVRALALQGGEEQTAVPGGRMGEAAFHVYEPAPERDFAFLIDPNDAASVAQLDVWDGNRAALIKQGLRFDQNPVSTRLRFGLYSLDVGISSSVPNFRARSGIPAAVTPRASSPRILKVVP